MTTSLRGSGIDALRRPIRVLDAKRRELRPRARRPYEVIVEYAADDWRTSRRVRAASKSGRTSLTTADSPSAHAAALDSATIGGVAVPVSFDDPKLMPAAGA